MEFRLTYEGPLLATQVDDEPKPNKLRHKQDIRRHFHDQLNELYVRDGRLRPLTISRPMRDSEGVVRDVNTLQDLSKLHQIGGVGWVPLIEGRWGLGCSLDILFLRHEPKGGIVQSGDLDNRIKTLFDGLKMPKEHELPRDFDPKQQPEPFLCLMSGDELITDFRVTADRWLKPPKSSSDSEVHLVIEARTFVVNHEEALKHWGSELHR